MTNTSNSNKHSSSRFSTELEKLFQDYPIHSQSDAEDPLVIAKLFDTAGSATWWLTEFDPETKNAFGFVTGMTADEWGYIHIPELENLVHQRFGIPRVERDLYFDPTPFSQIQT